MPALKRLGFGLAAAEVAPQLRLQYFDQPIGEFLSEWEPIRTWKGVPVILDRGNGGAGLVLIGQDAAPYAEYRGIPFSVRGVQRSRISEGCPRAR